MKALSKTNKYDRKRQVLIKAVDYYILTGKAVGSDALKTESFEDLSSATIRNYFVQLEEEGLLTQAHTSGGRIPTSQGFRIYANECLEQIPSLFTPHEAIKKIAEEETKELSHFLSSAANTLSDLSEAAVFLSHPRFDQDYVIDIKLVAIDSNRCLCIIVTDFGVVQTEILHTTKKLSAFTIKRLEAYFHFRLHGRDLPENLDQEEEELAQKFYNELMVRYIVQYTNFTDQEIMRTGFSKLLNYKDLQDTELLMSSLELFENAHSMRLLLKECMKQNRLKFWIADDLNTYTKKTPDCAVIAVPYYINKQIVGAIGLLAPIRVPYAKLFELLTEFSQSISQALTRNIYKYKVSFRQPEQELLSVQKVENRLLGTSSFMLLENQIKES